jgi:hypothetical protein
MKEYYEFVYGQYIESQIYYAVKIIDSLTVYLAESNPERYFLDSQLCLNLITNIANVLDSRVKRDRSKHLVEFFEISLNEVSTILNHDIRNTNEHYDERMDDLIELSRVTLNRKDVGNIKKLMSTLQVNDLTGYADVDNGIIYSINRKLERISIELQVVRRELLYIVDKIHKKIEYTKSY